MEGGAAEGSGAYTGAVVARFLLPVSSAGRIEQWGKRGLGQPNMESKDGPNGRQANCQTPQASQIHSFSVACCWASNGLPAIACCTHSNEGGIQLSHLSYISYEYRCSALLMQPPHQLLERLNSHTHPSFMLMLRHISARLPLHN